MLTDTVEQSNMHTPAHPQPRTRRPLIAVLVTIPVAAALVITAVGPGPAAGSAEAAEALRDAANVTITTTDPVVGPGHYLKVTTEAAYLAYESDEDGRLTAYRAPSVTEVFIPADPGVEWVQRLTAEPATDFYGDAARGAAERDWKETIRGGVVRVTRDPAGDFVHAAELGGPVADIPMPQDPAQALAFLHNGPYGDGTDVGALAYAAQLLRGGTMTASQRSVLYRALAMLPGIRITDGSAVLDGRTGIAFSLNADVNTPEIIVDPSTGLFIGERSLTTATTGAIPAGTEESYTAVTTTVVAEAP